MDIVRWDAETRQVEDHRWRLVIRTGWTWHLHNRLASLTVLRPDLSPVAYNAVWGMLRQISGMNALGSIIPGVPEVIHRCISLAGHEYHLVTIWMIKLQGKTGKRAPAWFGEFRFVTCLSDDVEALLDRHFAANVEVEALPLDLKRVQSQRNGVHQ